MKYNVARPTVDKLFLCKLIPPNRYVSDTLFLQLNLLEHSYNTVTKQQPSV